MALSYSSLHYRKQRRLVFNMEFWSSVNPTNIVNVIEKNLYVFEAATSEHNFPVYPWKKLLAFLQWRNYVYAEYAIA